MVRTRAIEHDPNNYADPDRFDPESWMTMGSCVQIMKLVCLDLDAEVRRNFPLLLVYRFRLRLIRVLGISLPGYPVCRTDTLDCNCYTSLDIQY